MPDMRDLRKLNEEIMENYDVQYDIHLMKYHFHLLNYHIRFH